MSPAALDLVAIGTSWRIETERDLPPALVRRIVACVETFDATYSRFRSDSLVWRLREGPAAVAFPDDAVGLFALYRRLWDATDGAVTPLVGGVLEHLGYDAEYTLRVRPGSAPTVPAWDEVLLVEGNVVTTSAPVVLDLGAAGKGYLVDLVAGLVNDAGVDRFVIDASGDLLRRGPGVEEVALEDPYDPTRAIGLVRVGEGAVCASSTRRRTWGEGVHHVVDPARSAPTDDVVGTWVTSPTCAVADGLATALFLVEPERLRPHFAFEHVRLRADGSADYSAGWDGEVFT